MGGAIVRNVIGYLVQILPCAALCLLPFRNRFRTSPRRAWFAAAGILAVGLVPFLIIAVFPLISPDGASNEFYIPLQNFVFLLVVGALFVLYVRVVDADPAQKTFVFSLAMLVGFFATFTSSSISYLMGLAEEGDGIMYYPPRLVFLAATNMALLLAMLPAMRSIERMLAAHVASSVWWRMAALPLLLVLTLLVGVWLPQLDYASLYFCQGFVLAIDAVFLVWWMLHMVRTAIEQTKRQATLERALRDHASERETLASELTKAREHVAALEQLVAQGEADIRTHTPQPIVLSTPTRAVSFLPDEITYADSLNRVRSVHFASGESVPIDMTLAAIVEALPRDRFVYCHRSIVVNLHHVRQITAQEIVLDTGGRLPVSRRRLAELREAFAGAQDTPSFVPSDVHKS